MDAASQLSDFERAYLEKLRNRECPKVRVKFMPDDEVPADTDFVLNAQDAVQSKPPDEDEFEVMNEFAGRRASFQYIDPRESDKLEREVDVHKYKSYYKNISKSMKAFDATFAKGSNPKED